jgi:hypothetical protein
MKPLFTALALILLLAGCSDSGSQIMNKNITGKAGELVIVISKKSWDDLPGNLLRQTLAQPQQSLPQDEPLFDLISVPHEAFKEIFQTTRNIIQTRISPIVENPGITFTDNIWAYPQATVQINARNNEEFEQLFNENSDKIIGYFLKAERERIAANYSNYHDKAVKNTLDQKYDILLNVPPGFQISQEGKDFVWLRYETPEISQALLVYWFPYTSDSTFTLNYLLNKRDSILRVNVPGPTEGSFMTTERRVDPLFQIIRHNKNYAADIRGLWRVENDFMGGPFVLLAELDAYRQRVVVADGFVYAPSKDKRNFIRQVEAMVYSMAFNDQEKNDRLNSQAQMGN